MNGRVAQAARLTATIAALLGSEAALWRSGRVLPRLSVDPQELARTLTEADALTVTASAIRLIALAVGGGLIVLTTAGLAARAAGATALVARCNRWTPGTLRYLLDGALGIGLAASISLGALPAGAAPARAAAAARPPVDDPPDPDTDPSDIARPVPTLRRLTDGTEAQPGPPDPGTTLRRLPDAPDTEPARPSPAGPPPAPADAPTFPGPAPAPVPANSTEVVVQPGDSFWRLAERQRAAQLGRHPSEAEVGAYWQELVASNRHRLVVTDNPDLIFPGQVMELPGP